MLKTANRRLSLLSLKYGAMEAEGCPPQKRAKGLRWIPRPQLHGTISPNVQIYAFLEADTKAYDSDFAVWDEKHDICWFWKADHPA